MRSSKRLKESSVQQDDDLDAIYDLEMDDNPNNPWDPSTLLLN